MSKFFKELFVVVVILALGGYAGWLTVERAAELRYKDGVKEGYNVGHELGLERGRQQACMSKPI